ncbi:LOW QUALITY PROTEIN: hypothetical protein HID58_061428 [Brassica napus]|uniref:Uncharacterized protein n=1 Tax=Brassica napus TaxID=3708 RepID=A0ABQ7ZYM3_BRANA|nr:LOW QUALITY PROTEIN: hypothetical protein HID58_061428 [Brassica napus]
MYADTLFLGATNAATRYCSTAYCICREKSAGMSYGIFTSQVGKKDSIVQMLIHEPYNVADKWVLEHDFLRVVAAVHIGWILLFDFVFAYCNKFLKFQKKVKEKNLCGIVF